MKRWLLVLLLVPALAPAYPEMVRHGYTGCITCHVSPDGGGVLTAYGRALSAEVLSTWGRGNEKESAALYGLVPTPEWLALGGDVRWVQTYLDNPSVRSFRSIFMQADVEAAFTAGKFTVSGTAGWSETGPPGGEFLSRRHFLLFKATEELALRAGRFPVAYGIRLPDHIVEIRRGLGWDQGRETYNLEASWARDPFEVFVTAVGGRPDSPSLDREKGGALRAALAVGGKHKVGLGYYYGESSLGRRHVVGPYGILGFTPRFFVLAEADFQNTRGSWRFVDYLRVNYEVLQGLHLFVTQEFNGALESGASNREIYGVGTQFFPRPHFELLFTLQKRRDLAIAGAWADFAFLLLHFYL